MLKYSVRLGDDNFKRDELVWSEKYVSPDLSFISGVTSQHNHIDKNEFMSASLGADTNFAALNLTTTNVCRNGYIVIKNKKYKIETGEKSTTGGGTFRYVDINGVYYYITGDTITVKNWLATNSSGNVIEKDVTGTISGNYVELNTIVWIEDETVTIDGHTYFYDRYGCEGGGIKYYEDGGCLKPEEITNCEDILFRHFDKESEYQYVTKFVLSKKGDDTLAFDKLSYCTYFYYVYYKDNYCPVRRIKIEEDPNICIWHCKNCGNIWESGKTTPTGCLVCDATEPSDFEVIHYKYICQIPTRLINGNPNDNTTTEVNVRTIGGIPSRISQLKGYDAYIMIDTDKFPVEYTLQNANSGDEIAVYLSNGTESLSMGDKITLSYDNGTETTFPVYNIGGNKFVMYDNAKYMVEDKIADTVEINGVEYDIEYPDGKEDGEDALVHIEDNKIPMRIINNGKKLERYGYIVTGDTSADTQTYAIKSYDGVRINGTVYRVDTVSETITANMPYTNEFNIDNIEGSSMLICTPYLNPLEYSIDFIDEITQSICGFYVANEYGTRVYAKNRAFGERPITPSVGYARNPGATSSDGYYDLFNKLTLFANTGYIQIKLPLTMNVANNAMQEDIVNRDFFEAEKEKAINPIVDMEKDVYVPMFMEGSYNGSETGFRQVTEIDVNLHFRSRREDNWKVKDKNTNIEDNGDDNWFCTDYYPYKQLLSGGTSAATILMNTSDLVGLLYFDNDDVFYQKSNIEKSFLRFSYYDSPDPNTQSLLYTSTVFMDEHAIYKKYVDNSRRNINYYGMVEETKYKYVYDPSTSSTTKVEDTDFSGNTINRISVLGECLKEKKVSYTYNDVDMGKLSGDTNRTSSRFVIKNRYATDTSAEGFYVYIFREYSENLYPKPIYMKVEFNHAGVGRTIPFIIPMRWSGSTENENEMLPVSALTLDDENLTYLKQGYPLSYVYAQTYIPLYAVYDFKHKQYAYVFDDRYVSENNGKIVLNMFELKVKDEDTATLDTRAAVRNNNIERANIDINTKQFPDNI